MARYRNSFSSKSTSRNAEKFISGLFKVGASMASTYAKEAKRQQREQARQVAAYNRFLEQQEREELRQIKQHEMAMRRAEREREKAEREREKAAKLQAKLDEQKRVEDEISDIEDNNYLWTNVHGFISQIVTLDDVNDVIAKCDYEQQNDVRDGFFKTHYPEDSSIKQKVEAEADSKFDIQKAQEDYFASNKRWSDLKFNELEPTEDDVAEELASEAKEIISAFFPWKQSKLRRAYVEEHLNERFEEIHNEWLSKKNEYETQKKELQTLVEEKEKAVSDMQQAKKDYIRDRVQDLFDVEVKKWQEERDGFYESLRQSMHNLIDGDKNYVIAAICSLFPDDELPMEYFVDFAYEEESGRVMVDLDLPEIEDIPVKKIILTPTGKKSIRLKGQTDLRSDYANCVFGLAMYVAYSIFNISLKVKSVEISAFTQRKDANSALATDQYVFVVDFTRDLFSEIDFSRFSSIQIMDFFHRHYNMTKSFDMKQLILSTAYSKMEEFVPTDYCDFIASLPPQEEKVSNSVEVSINSSDNNPKIRVDDALIETFDKSVLFIDEVYSFIKKMSVDNGVSNHADYLNGIKVTWTSGGATGDGDTDTYLGRLFFCLTVDLYRSLKKMHINMNDLKPESYPFALLVDRIYMRLNAQYASLYVIESPYRAFCDMLKTMDAKMPIFDHYFMLGEVLFDYTRDLSWYNQYLGLMRKHAEIIECAIHSNNRKLKYVEDFCSFVDSLSLSTSNANPILNDIDMRHLDPLFDDAARLIVMNQSGSTSIIQRKFAIGYNRANRLMDQLEKAGIVGAAYGSRPREVLIHDEYSLNNLLSALR